MKRVFKIKMGAEKHKKNHILQCLASALMGQSQGAWICPPEPAVLGEELKWFEAIHFSQCRAEDDPVHSGGQIKGIASKTACCQEEMMGGAWEPPAQCWV